jgi:hypothetical protein
MATLIDESKIIFFTGAPGSKWSAIAHLLALSGRYNINISDYNDDRVYEHPGPKISHLGAYWGPGFGVGEKFNRINTLSKEDIYAQIETPYEDKNWKQHRIIKCHQFSLNLDWIKENFPTSKIAIVLRPDITCKEQWLYAGGFDGISYPNYNSYYKNEEVLEQKIAQENSASRKFIAENNLELHTITRPFLSKHWYLESVPEENLNVTPVNEVERYIISILRAKGNSGPEWLLDTSIAMYNF